MKFIIFFGSIEQKLLDMFIQERIDMLLTRFYKFRPSKSVKGQQHVLQAEQFVDALPKLKRELIQEYIECASDCLASEEPYLYHQGFVDGIITTNLLKIL